MNSKLDHELKLAVRDLDLAKVKQLIDQGANPEVCLQTMVYPPLFVHMCSYTDERILPIVQYFIDIKSNIFAKDIYGNQALHYAATFNSPTFKLLLDVGFDLKIKNEQGFDPLLLALHQGHIELADSILPFYTLAEIQKNLKKTKNQEPKELEHILSYVHKFFIDHQPRNQISIKKQPIL